MIQGKKILIYGLGKEGMSSANYLSLKNEVIFADDKKESEIDQTTKNKLKNFTVFYGTEIKSVNFDLIVRSPGIKPSHPRILELIKQGAKLTSQIKIFFDECPAEIIGVTGTKGKGTTSTLIYEMLKHKYKNTYLAGNIGIPPLDILSKLNDKSLVILELSSFQLTDITKSPHIAVVLMITSEHLNWHENINEYHKSKLPLVSNQKESDFAVINQDYAASESFKEKTKAKVLFFSKKMKTNGAYIENGNIFVNLSQNLETICKTSEVMLPGQHNLENILAAVVVAKLKNVENNKIKDVIKSFPGLKHRLQLVKVIDGVKYYNDSFSTTPETTIAAIKAFKQPKILIIGGSSKNSDFSPLCDLLNSDNSIRAIILIGQEAPKIKSQILNKTKAELIDGPQNLGGIVKIASDIAQNSDVVLMSPACASFDMFKNYEERGDQFIKAVNKLSQTNNSRLSN